MGGKKTSFREASDSCLGEKHLLISPCFGGVGLQIVGQESHLRTANVFKSDKMRTTIVFLPTDPLFYKARAQTYLPCPGQRTHSTKVKKQLLSDIYGIYCMSETINDLSVEPSLLAKGERL